MKENPYRADSPAISQDSTESPAGSKRPQGALPSFHQGSLRLFGLWGTDVFIHWSWFLVAFFLIQGRRMEEQSFAWAALQYVMGFAIVLMHEFGHVLACRQVGGTAERVVLWPLGGLALANPPPRPGALLWTVAAGPLVNVALVPITIGLALLSGPAGWDASAPELSRLLMMLAIFNIVILVFNLLPIYPLDGGQILQALLWFFIGRTASLKIAAGMGVVAGIGLVGLAIAFQEWWGALMASFLVISSLGGLSRAKTLSQIDRIPRRPEFACPSCGASPPAGVFWRCRHCMAPTDLFAPATACPHGGLHASQITCWECGSDAPPQTWSLASLNSMNAAGGRVPSPAPTSDVHIIDPR